MCTPTVGVAPHLAFSMLILEGGPDYPSGTKKHFCLPKPLVSWNRKTVWPWKSARRQEIKGKGCGCNEKRDASPPPRVDAVLIVDLYNLAE